ncbi:MAG: hypothetical protein ACR2IF_00850 [Terriglobales bacterium]
MKRLPDVLTSVQYWASIAAILAAPGAWFTYYRARTESQAQTHDRVLNWISGIEAELDLLSLWARAPQGDCGYLASIPKEQYTRLQKDWFNPSRQIFTVNLPLLQSFTSFSELSRLAPLVRPLVMLNHSVRRIFDLHSELREFAHAHPELYGNVERKLASRPVHFTPEEQVYANIIFGMNLRIHVELIGGEDSADEYCLYKAFRTARNAIQEFKTNLKSPAAPPWFALLHIASAGFILLGLWQVLRWLRIL